VFVYSDEILKRYPTVRAGIVHASGLSNGPSSDGLLQTYQDEQRSAALRLATTPIADLPSIAAWRRAFTSFGAKPTQYRNAAEALLRRLAKQGEIPPINSLVDIANLVSVRHALPVAAFDLGGVEGSITVRFATGEERFIDLGTTAAEHPGPGEVVFVDESGMVCARRWCWRQSAPSATGDPTAEALIVIEGLHDAAAGDVDSALDLLTSLLAMYQPHASTRSSVLSSAHPGV
jgi:DNA/RNA-binding domain of Phe-tRNA-synthetase-like protein